MTGGASAPPSSQRIDSWLWCARMFRTRTLASKIVSEGVVRLVRDGRTSRVEKPSVMVRPGDRIAFIAGSRVRVLEVRACALRRGPAPEARMLYADCSAPAGETTPEIPRHARGPLTGDL